MKTDFLFNFEQKAGISGLYAIDSDISLIDGSEKIEVSYTSLGFEAEKKIGECLVITSVEKKDSVCVRSDTFTNSSDHPVILYHFLCRFTLNNADNDIYTQSSSWTNESNGGWQKLISSVCAANRGFRTTAGAAPFAAIWNNNSERGFAFHLMGGAAWEINITKVPDADVNCVTVVEIGLSSKGMRLEVMPGETIELPKIIFYDFDCKLDMGCTKLHEYFNKNYPRKSLPVIYNTWFLNFDGISYDLVAEQVERAAKIGCEYFVIDAGWFGEGDSWSDAIGIWEENQTGGFCGRMRELSELVQKLHMKFGLWLEPERALEKAPAVHQHPEYFIPFGGYYFLDFANENAREYILNVIFGLIEKYQIEFIKMDFNADCFQDANHAAFYRYHQGHKKFIQKLRDKYPDLYIENCASGGTRMELNSMTEFDGTWFSDNQNPFDGTRIFQDTILRMPPSCIEKWCAIRSVDGFTSIYAENNETERLVTVTGATWAGIESVSMNYIKAFALGGPLGITCNLSQISDSVFGELKDYITEFKQMREFYKKAVCRPLAISDSFTVLQYQDDEENTIILQAFEKKPIQSKILIYPKLQHNKQYVYNDTIYTSESLREDGIEIGISHLASYGDQCSMVVLKEKML